MHKPRFLVTAAAIAAFSFAALAPISAMSDTSSPSPSPSASVSGVPLVASLQALAGQTTVDTGSFLSAVLQFILHHGGLGTPLTIACICLLVIASVKVSFLDSLLWDKLGYAQAFVAPVLGLVVGFIMLGVNGTTLTLAAVFTFLGSGAGAVGLHELLDAVKGIPGLGTAYVNIITAIENFLGGNPQGAVPSSSTATTTTATPSSS